MTIASTILFFTYLLITIKKIPKLTVVMIAAAITLMLGLIPPDKVFSYIDFKVIFLLVSMMMIAFVADRSGIFTWLAIKILQLAKGNPKLILIALTILTALLSAFLNNATIIILLLPISFTIAKELKMNPEPFLISEIFASNIGGTATLIGDPPNIIIGAAAGFTFMDFIKELAPVIIIIFIICTALLVWMFRKELVSTPELMNHVKNLDSSGTIRDKRLMIVSILILSFVILGFVFSDIIHIEAYIIAFTGASIILLFQSPDYILEEIEWNTILFFIGLFIIIGGLVETGGIKFLASQVLSITKGNVNYASILVLWASGILSAFIDNIPYTITMIPLINNLHNSMNLTPLWWSLSLGACLGGNATIIGAAGNIIAAEASSKAGYPISFFKFMKYGALITFISLLISNAYLYLRFLM